MAYGGSLYGDLLYGGTPESTDPPDIVPPDLMAYLPAYWHDIRDMVELQTTLAEELGISIAAATDLANQFYVSTATWGLANWEQEFGLITDPSMSYEWRREIVTAKLRGHGTITKQKLIEAAASFSGGEVEVLEYPAEYRFVVKFIGFLGIPPNMAGFIQMLEQIKPAHLAYTFEYTYTTWDMLKNLNWQEASLKTWNQLRTYGGA